MNTFYIQAAAKDIMQFFPDHLFSSSFHAAGFHNGNLTDIHWKFFRKIYQCIGGTEQDGPASERWVFQQLLPEQSHIVQEKPTSVSIRLTDQIIKHINK